MKPCPHCNAAIENEAANFCPVCGAPQQENAAFSLQPGASAAVPESDLRKAGFSVLVRAFTSRLYLALCVLYTLTLVLNIGVAFSQRTAVFSTLSSTLGNVDMAAYSTGFIVGILFSQIFSVLMCAGMWMTRHAGTQALQTGRFNTGGLTLYRTAFLVQSIFACIGLGLLTILMLVCAGVSNTEDFAWAFAGDAELASLLMAVFLLLGIVLAVSFVLTIVLTVKIAKTVASIRQTAQTGFPTAYVSRFVIVLYFISAGFSVASLLLSLFAIQTAYDGLTVLMMAVLCGYMATFAVALQKYRKAMRAAAQPESFSPEV